MKSLSTIVGLLFALWPSLPAGAAVDPPQMVLQVGPPSQAQSMAISPDDQLFAGAAQDGEITLLNVCALNLVRSFSVNSDGYQPLVGFSPNSQTLAVFAGQEGKVILYNVRSWHMEKTLAIGQEPAGLAFSPDGKSLAVAGYQSVSIWDYRSGRRLRSITTHAGDAAMDTLLAFSPDGSMLATAGRDNMEGTTIEFWNTRTGELLHSLAIDQAVESLAISPNSRHFAIGMDMFDGAHDSVEIRDIDRGSIVSTLKPPSDDGPCGCSSDNVTGLSYSRDGRTLTVAINSGFFMRWTPLTNQNTEKAGGGGFELPTVVSPDGTIAAACFDDGSLRLYEADSGQIRQFPEDEFGAAGVAFSGNGSSLFQSGALGLESVSSGDVGQTIQWDMATGALEDQALIRKNDTLEASSDYTQIVADLTGKNIYVQTAEKIAALDVSHNLVHAYTLKKGYMASAMALSPDRRLLAVGGDRDHTLERQGFYSGPADMSAFLFLYDAQNGKDLFSLPVKGQQVLAVRFIAGGSSLVSVSDNGQIDIWNTSTGKLSHKVTGVYGIMAALSGDGSTAVVESQRDAVDVYRVWPRKHLLSVPISASSDSGFALSRNGTLLAIHGNGGPIGIWDVSTGRKMSSFNPYSTYTRLAFSADSRLLACAGNNGAVQLWDSGKGRLRATLRAFTVSVNGTPKAFWLACTPAGYYEGSPDIDRFLAWRVNGKVQSMSALSAKYDRPDLVQDALWGRPQPAQYEADQAREEAAEKAEERGIGEILAAAAAKNKPAPALKPTTPSEKLKAALSALNMRDQETAAASVAEIKTDLAAGADPNSQGEYGMTALSFFAYVGDLDQVKALIAQRAKVELADIYHETPLLEAADGGHDDIIAALIAAGAQLKDSSGHDLLALQGNRAALSQALLDLFEPKTQPGSPFPEIDESRDPTAYLLLRLGAGPNMQDSQGETPLMLAEFSEPTPLARQMVAAGADVNMQDKLGETALELACRYDGTPFVRFLLSHGANPNVIDSQGGTALMTAATDGKTDSALALLNSDANPNVVTSRSDGGETPLIVTAQNGYLDICRSLIAHGADVNAVETYDGSTPLTTAVQRSDATMVRLLLAHGANVNVRTKNGETPLQIDKEQDPTDSFGIAVLLRNAGEKR